MIWTQDERLPPRYALPLAMTAYLYVKMSRELQDRQDDSGGQAAPRLSLVVQQLNNQQTSRDNSTHCRDSVCSSRSCGGSRRGNGSGAGSSGAPYVFRSPRVNYDIYDAELDVSKERRAHWYLGTMTTVFAICLLPLMFLRYDNTNSARKTITE
ncbi:hypothetical protein AAG570_003233 [Ranatra chinensis]|uniref:Uncharacterized protein n=1 Tax=Ranatra chinensis TaxID=642074 RepID=A0ABD0YP33_9HEMI